MSNPLKAPTTTLSARQLELSRQLPDTFLNLTPEEQRRWDNFADRRKEISVVQGFLTSSLAMDIAPTVILPRELVCDQQMLKQKRPLVAMAACEPIVLRKRTASAKAVANAIFSAVPKTGVKPVWRQDKIAERNANMLFASAGTEYALGRLRDNYPRVGSTVKAITRSEAIRAIRNCGIDTAEVEESLRTPIPLNPQYGEEHLRMNIHADNGFPVRGTMADPGCATMVLQLATDLRMMFVQAQRTGGREAVVALVRALEEGKPHLMLVRGKAKADMYSMEKIKEQKMRFYNAFPRPLVLNMQVATQRLEFLKRHVLYSGNSAQGLPLVRGGADDMVRAMQLQMDRKSHAYVHVGDDTFIAVRCRFGVMLLSLDCSNFDLTQHAELTREVHEGLYRELAMIDPTAASVWYALARERLVVVARSVVRRFRHAGPSGMPLQSTVNDVLMEVLCDRLIAAWPKDDIYYEVLERADLDALIQRVGREMGFKVRLEEVYATGGSSIELALEESPFLFLGYRWYRHPSERVAVFADLPRAVTQMQYPTASWMKKEELVTLEAVRLASIIMSMGVPPPELREAYEAGRFAAAELLETALQQGVPASIDNKVAWFTQEGVAGLELADKSVRGLFAALRRDPEDLWLTPIDVGVSLPEQDPLGWYDLVEQETREESERTGVLHVRPGHGPLPRPAVITLPANPLAHPATLANDGRIPPTARWAPDRLPVIRTQEWDPARPVRPRKGGRRRDRQAEAMDWGESDSDRSEDYY